MADDNEGDKPEGTVQGTINAVTGLAKAIPVYEDALQPAAKEVGQSLETVAKAVNVALAPVSGLVWGYEKIKDFIDNKVSEKLQNVPEENIVSPPANIAGPALESLRYTGGIDELRELYANLIASSMDSNTLDNVHPCFVEIIKQLSSDEAKLLNYFSTNIQLPLITIRSKNDDDSSQDVIRFFSDIGEQIGMKDNSDISSYIDNLCRLGILEVPGNLCAVGLDEEYQRLTVHSYTIKHRKIIDKQDGRKSVVVKKMLYASSLGLDFIDSCVRDHQT